jgi:RNA polymerase sigma-70 factor, ECF subfamily
MTGSAQIAAFKNGDPAVFEAWFHLHYAELGRFAMSYLSDPEEAQDLVQQVFLTLWEKRSDLPEDLNLRAYLFTAVRNACYNWLAHRRVRQGYQQAVEAASPNWEPSPDILAEARELEARIQAAIAALPDRCGETFRLSREEGLSYPEIAARMGISRKTVEAQMGRALKLLRERLGDSLLVWILLGQVG